MSRIILTKTAAPATPATNKSIIFIDNADNKIKQIDSNGVISTLNNDGLQNRSIITNGGFSIQQRLAVASTAIAGISTTTRGGQVSDRWAVTSSVASNLNWQQVDTSGAVESGLESRYYGSIISASAGKKVMLSQFIINSEMAHLRGKKVRVSVKTSQKVGSEGQIFKLGLLQLTATGTVDVCPAFLSGAWSTSGGTDPVWGTNLAAITPDVSPVGENGTINGNFLEIISTFVWQRSSVVFTVPTNAKNLVVVLFSNTTGGTTDNISIAEFQLTQGPEIVDYKEPPIAETLLRCQRFFAKSFPISVAPAASVSVATGGFGSIGLLAKAGSGTALGSQIGITFPVRMWKVPTITYYTPITTGALVYRHNGVTPAVQGTTATLASSLTDIGAIVTATNEATTNGVVGDLVSIHWTAEAEFIT